MESPFKTLEDTEADTEIVIDDLVTGIETPLDTMTIASQDGRESDQEDSSSQDDSATPPLGKGKTKVDEPWMQELDRWMKTPLGQERVREAPLRATPRLPDEGWEQYNERAK